MRKIIKIVTILMLLGSFKASSEDAPTPSGSASIQAEIKVSIGDTFGIFKRINPAHYNIQYPDFYMLETEVTNAMFKEYLAATGKRKDDTDVLEIVSSKRATTTVSAIYSIQDKSAIWHDNKYPQGQDNRPVVMITFLDAQAFCKWLSETHPELGLFRLPTWNEWMIAAYGSNRRYPWGDKWDRNLAHTYYGYWGTEWNWHTEEVKSRPDGRTPEGLYGMLGNVSEYIAEKDSTSKDYLNPGSRWMGGAFNSGCTEYSDVPHPPRKDYWGYSHSAVNRDDSIGFRIILDTKKDMSLLKRARVFAQNNKSWMIKPAPEKSTAETKTDK
ncbi:MAG: SUMF1/EgtB/PvdO family nonheme iron enzyme [Lentisphaerota bacterium]